MTSVNRRVHLWHSLFSLLGGVLLSWAVPFLLLLAEPLRTQVTLTLLVSMLTGGIIAGILIRFRIRKHSFLLHALSVETFAVGEASIAPAALANFLAEPPKIVRAWLYPQYLALALFATPLRPSPLDWTTSLAVGLLAVLILSTASFPLLVLIRNDFYRIVERAPANCAQELVIDAEKNGKTRYQLNRRIVAAVAMPVVFVALGSALIVNAHLRRDDERFRAETARMLALGALELHDGAVQTLEAAVREATKLGFPAQVASQGARYGVILERGGIAELTVPLSTGSARVRYDSSVVPVVGMAPLLVALLATITASLLGLWLGNLLTTDLQHAAKRVRALGSNVAVGASGVSIGRPPRFQMVSDLLGAIERLADRFSVFAQAQEDAIRARAAATRTRGLFFATVSHDLKGPLNSILGFTQLVSIEPLTNGQHESLSAIHSRARELLALIETILDAARVEEGQLSLVRDEIPFVDLYDAAKTKASELSSGYTLQIFNEIENNIPPLLVDRLRVLRALATLIAYSVRSNKGGKMWIRAERESESTVRIDIDVPGPEHAPPQLEAMLSTQTSAKRRDHRGLALGLRLARSVVELHGGAVRVVDRGKKGAMFCVTLPTVKRPLERQAVSSVPLPGQGPPSSPSPGSVPPPSSARLASAPASSVPPPGSARPSNIPRLPPFPAPPDVNRSRPYSVATATPRPASVPPGAFVSATPLPGFPPPSVPRPNFDAASTKPEPATEIDISLEDLKDPKS